MKPRYIQKAKTDLAKIWVPSIRLEVFIFQNQTVLFNFQCWILQNVRSEITKVWKVDFCQCNGLTMVTYDHTLGRQSRTPWMNTQCRWYQLDLCYWLIHISNQYLHGIKGHYVLFMVLIGIEHWSSEPWQSQFYSNQHENIKSCLIFLCSTSGNRRLFKSERRKKMKPTSNIWNQSEKSSQRHNFESTSDFQPPTSRVTCTAISLVKHAYHKLNFSTI